MRSMTLVRYSAAAFGATAAALAVQAFALGPSIPLQHLQLAWTLTRVLLQL